MPSRPARRRWSQSCIVSPMTLCPSARSMAATVEESTPPDMATAIVRAPISFRLLDSNMLAVDRAQLAQSRGCFRRQCERKIDLFSGGLLSQTKPNAGPRPIRRRSHRDQHVRRLNRPGRTCRPGRNRETFEIKRDYHRFTIDVIEIYVRRVRHTRSAPAVHACTFDLGENSLFQPIAQRTHCLIAIALEPMDSQLCGLAQRDNARHVLCSSPARTLVTSPVKKRLQTGSFPHIKRAYALRRMHLVSRNRERMAANPIYVDRNFSRRLHRVGVKKSPRFRRDLANFLHWLQHPCFVVGDHDRNQFCVRSQRTAHIIRINQPKPVHGHIRHLAPSLLEMLARVQYGVMLDGRSDDVIAGLHQSRDRQIVGFGAAAGEDDFRRAAAEQRSNRLPRLLDGRSSFLPVAMNRRRIAEALAKIRAHGSEHFRQNRGGSVIVEVNPRHRDLTLFYLLPLFHRARNWPLQSG